MPHGADQGNIYFRRLTAGQDGAGDPSAGFDGGAAAALSQALPPAGPAAPDPAAGGTALRAVVAPLVPLPVPGADAGTGLGLPPAFAGVAPAPGAPGQPDAPVPAPPPT